MWDGFNKRKFPRLNLRCEITVHSDHYPSPIPTTTENLGSGGVCVILNKPLERFSKCRLRLELDEKSEDIECEGKVVWTVATGGMKSSKSRFDTGIEFEGLDQTSADRIRKFILSKAQKNS